MEKKNVLNAWPFGPRADYSDMNNIPSQKSDQVKVNMRISFQNALQSMQDPDVYSEALIRLEKIWIDVKWKTDKLLDTI